MSDAELSEIRERARINPNTVPSQFDREILLEEIDRLRKELEEKDLDISRMACDQTAYQLGCEEERGRTLKYIEAIIQFTPSRDIADAMVILRNDIRSEGSSCSPLPPNKMIDRIRELEDVLVCFTEEESRKVWNYFIDNMESLKDSSTLFPTDQEKAALQNLVDGARSILHITKAVYEKSWK